MELLHVGSAASQPSLLSSLWSLHVHLQSEARDVDLRSASQTSLPTALRSNYSPVLRTVKSLPDLGTASHDQSTAATPSEPIHSWHRSMCECLAPKQLANLTINAWLQNVEAANASSVNDIS
ncbi:hypothetical protein Tcan_00121 [Toxocara canis]|uniref:Uncharacterized protein n=1 Tax=Toxocara canis TaxID=6265 RepID=A0A0B2VEM8_TOXCA|nr:hypothetical protein Tcan_00121 [Toxocara canis]